MQKTGVFNMFKLSVSATVVFICSMIALSIVAQDAGKKTLPKPFWTSDIMEGESVLFIKESAETEPKAMLLFKPTKIISVQNSAGNVTYAEGQDYVWKQDTREVILPPGSRITFKTPQDLRRQPKSQQFTLPHRDGNGEILFGAGHEYHDMQTMITYKHEPDAWTGPKPSFDASLLPRTLKKLQNKQEVTIAILGDSISTGAQSSGWAKVAPFQPPWQDLLVMNLEAEYGAKVILKNFAVSGTGSEWGLKNIGNVAASKPDLVILAFGMNDACGVQPDKYQANIKGMIDAVNKVQPEAEFILIASMLGNKDWVGLNQGLFTAYREALAKLCKPGIAMADMTSMWTELLKYKKDWDMTGNGVNHPNDFGHRIYAQIISTLLIPNH
ncbi:MAG: SGNH/GDSL hydrolase family protein, partial [Deltaproteobacteria bacterium]